NTTQKKCMPCKISKQLYWQTPLLASFPLSEKVGKPTYLKLENLQPSGSFKNRGIGTFCQKQAQRGCKGFVSSSGGNAGLAAAFSGKQLGLPVHVFLPTCSS